MEIRLGEKIRVLRRNAGLTQEQLAEALRVTTGAVYKWESGRATPELEMLVDIAEFFETSVDALLDYGWQKLSMGKAVEKLRQFARDKRLDEGMRYAEQVLQKYPNSFDVVLESADVYFLTMGDAGGKYCARAVELYERALMLMDQNTDERINPLLIQKRIASCYCYMDRMDDAIALLKKYNVDGMNDYLIGLLISQDEKRAEESLQYLSNALGTYYSRLYNVCIGYANAYSALEKLDETTELVQWFRQVGKGLRNPAAVNWMDKCDVRLLTILAEMDMLRGDEEGATRWLLEAKDTAQRFDASPEYRTGMGLKFYHGSGTATSYDDMGSTAMAVIENFMADDVAGKNLRPLWGKIRAEE